MRKVLEKFYWEMEKKFKEKFWDIWGIIKWDFREIRGK